MLWVHERTIILHCSHHLPVQLTPGTVTHTRLQLATWLGNTSSLLLVHENDIYLQRNPVDPEQPLALRITDTGVPGEIFNGVPDWLYQGELSIRNFLVSPNLNILCAAHLFQ